MVGVGYGGSFSLCRDVVAGQSRLLLFGLRETKVMWVPVVYVIKVKINIINS